MLLPPGEAAAFAGAIRSHFGSSVSPEVFAVSKAEQRLRLERVLQPTRRDCGKDHKIQYIAS